MAQLVIGVIDTSVAAAWCLRDEERTAEADLIIARLKDEKAIVPGLFWHEIRHALIKAERTGRIDELSAEIHLIRLYNFYLITDHDQNNQTTLDLARRHNLSAYDAAYLETARRHSTHLFTFDRSLSKACLAEGLF